MKLIIESYNYKKYIDAFLNSLNTPEYYRVGIVGKDIKSGKYYGNANRHKLDNGAPILKYFDRDYNGLYINLIDGQEIIIDKYERTVYVYDHFQECWILLDDHYYSE